MWFGHRFQGHTTRHAQFVGPHRHRRQGRCGVAGGSHGLRQSALERIPHQEQLRARSVQQRRELGLDTGPVGVTGQGHSLRLPMVHISMQGLKHGLRVAPGFGGQDLNALGQQHRRFALHLHPMLQVFNDLNPVAKLSFEGRQRLLAQWRARFGGITLPGHGIGNVEFGQGQQGLRLVSPFLRNRLLALAALDLFKFFTQ